MNDNMACVYISLAIFNALPLPRFLLLFKTFAKLNEFVISFTILKELSVEPSSINIISSAILETKPYLMIFR